MTSSIDEYFWLRGSATNHRWWSMCVIFWWDDHIYHCKISYAKHTSLREAVTHGSSCLSDHPHALRGFANNCSHDWALSIFTFSNSDFGIKISALILAVTHGIYRGIEDIVLAFVVISSPMYPSHLVLTWTRFHWSYTNSTLIPSNFGSQKNSILSSHTFCKSFAIDVYRLRISHSL